MAKIGARELALREMRERNAAPVKTSRGGGESGPVATPQRADSGTRVAPRIPAPSRGAQAASALSGAGVAPGPRETKSKPVVAQQVERPICNREVSGSIPLPGTKPKRGPPRIEDRGNTLTATKPWEALNMSRRSWYRRQAEKQA